MNKNESGRLFAPDNIYDQPAKLQFGTQTLMLSYAHREKPTENPASSTFVVDLRDNTHALEDTLYFANRRNPYLLSFLKSEALRLRDDPQTPITENKLRLLCRVYVTADHLSQKIKLT